MSPADMLRKHYDWMSDEAPQQWWQDWCAAQEKAIQQRAEKTYALITAAVPESACTPVGEPLLKHHLRVAQMVDEMDLLPDAVIAAIAAAATQHLADWPLALEEAAGKNVVQLVKGIEEVQKLTDFARVDQLNTVEERAAQAEGMRKMLLAMVSDIRVVLIKLAMRTRTMQYLGRIEDNPQKRMIAQETLAIFAPLANRLGVWQLKWQLEDLGFRYQNPQAYRDIAESLDEERQERLRYIADFSATLKNAMQEAGIHCEIAGRPKHIYSIWRKMQKKNLPFSGLYDIRAVRILVDSVADCYAALGIVHGLWQPIPGEFDDYISHPKANDYRSLHTVVVGPEDKGVEIQIRTFEMHHFAEYGVAAHWRYKEGGASDSAYERKIAWLRQLLDWRENMASSEQKDLAEAFQTELFNDTIYVLTPKGRVISLPEGSSPIDFAYALHTDVGHSCRGAKVNGRMVPLSTPLANGQRVEIITTKNGAPSPDWLTNGWIKSNRAISKVRAYIRAQHGDLLKNNGKVILERARARYGAGINNNQIKEAMGYSNIDDFLTAIGEGSITTKTLGRHISQLAQKAAAKAPTSDFVVRKSRIAHDKNGVLINGEFGLLTTLAKCCKPAPPDNITGFVTRDRGISIHRADCASLHNLMQRHPEKILAAEWDSAALGTVFSIDIEIYANDRNGLLRDVSDTFSRNKINVTGVQTHSKDQEARMKFTIEINHTEDLSRLIDNLSKIPSVTSVRRL